MWRQLRVCGGRRARPTPAALPPHTYASLHTLNVSGASSQRGPSLRRTKTGALGYGRHRPVGCRGEKGSLHAQLWLWAPSCFRRRLQGSEDGEAEACFQQKAVCSPLCPVGDWTGPAVPVPTTTHTHTEDYLRPSFLKYISKIWDQKSMREGHGCFQPNTARASWLGRGLQNIFPPQCELGHLPHPAGNTEGTSTGHQDVPSWVALKDRAGHQLDRVPSIIQEDSITFPSAAEGRRNPGLYARQATVTRGQDGRSEMLLRAEG